MHNDKITNVLLIGYGNMGQIIETEAKNCNCFIIDIIDPNNKKYNKSLSESNINKCDVIIEFTNPQSAFKLIDTALSYNKPIISGTTGWFSQIDDLKKKHDFTKSTLIYSSNYSVGMNLFYQLTDFASRLINESQLYDVYGLEAHHRKKLDSPSGTAKVLSDIILNNFKTKEKVRFDLVNKALEEDEFSFSSIRAGNITGYHKIGFDSLFDEIEISHNAKNRKGFAIGALLAAKYSLSITGIHDFKEIFTKVLLNAD